MNAKSKRAVHGGADQMKTNTQGKHTNHDSVDQMRTINEGKACQMRMITDDGAEQARTLAEMVRDMRGHGKIIVQA